MKLRRMMAFLSALLIMMVQTQITMAESTQEYYNSVGAVLSMADYNYLLKYLDEADLQDLSRDELNYLVRNIADDGVDITEEYYVTEQSGENETDIQITEQEAMDILNMKNVKINGSFSQTLLSSGYDVTRRTAVSETALRKVELKMINVAESYKRVRLTCTWLTIPDVKSYDVIGFRAMGSEAISITDISDGGNIVGYQYCDGKSGVKYTMASGNIKINGRGIGISIDLDDSASKSLKLEFYTTFGNASEAFGVAGTYQHAIKDITLSRSKSYTINSLGLGTVLKYSTANAKYYDGAAGLTVVGSVY